MAELELALAASTVQKLGYVTAEWLETAPTSTATVNTSVGTSLGLPGAAMVITQRVSATIAHQVFYSVSGATVAVRVRAQSAAGWSALLTP